DRLTREDVDAIRRRLARLDARGPWTRRTLALIARRPRVAASQLAKKLGRETLPVKVDVRKLKRLGLTQSFEVGYEVSPRGKAYLSAAARRRCPRPPGSGRRAGSAPCPWLPAWTPAGRTSDPRRCARRGRRSTARCRPGAARPPRPVRPDARRRAA